MKRRPVSCPGPCLVVLQVALTAAAVLPWAAVAQSDDFNDGNDFGWRRYTPLAEFGAAGRYTFPAGAYRIAADSSPAPDTLGPQRAGAVRSTPTYTRSRSSVDLVGWNNDINQSIGLIGRVSQLGFGTTQGYTYNYNTRSGYHQLNLVLNEAPAKQINESPFRIDPAGRYHLVFTMVGSSILGQMFSETNRAVALHSVFAVDETHASGTSGVFAFALDAGGPIDATFDNYAAEVPPKVRATLLDANPAVGEKPPAPVEAITLRLVSLETTINPDTIRLLVDEKNAELGVEEASPLLIVTHLPETPLDPESTHTAKLTFADNDGTQTFEWTFGAPPPAAPPVLAGATTLAGPWQTEGQATLDAGNRRFTLPVSGSQRFFRIADTAARSINRITIQAGTVIVQFE